MKEKDLVRIKLEDLPAPSEEEHKALQAISDESIDYSDIPKTDTSFWKGARLVSPSKKQITLRLDTDVLEWLKSVQPKGYQTLANAILRKEMLQHLED